MLTMKSVTHLSLHCSLTLHQFKKSRSFHVPLVLFHEKTHLPVIVDPSHATGKANLVEPMMIAAVAAGADGLEVEVHYDPRHAWSDGAQCLTPDSFAQAMAKCRQVAWAIGREM